MAGEDRRVCTQRDLLENLAVFCRLLRAEGLPVELSSVLFAAEGLKWVNSTDLDSFRSLLAAALAHSREELEKFRVLFQEFWLGEPLLKMEVPEGAAGQTQQGEIPCLGSEQREIHDGEFLSKTRLAVRYSPHSLKSPSLPAISPVEPASHQREAMRRLMKLLASRASRRFKPSPSGLRFSLRRTLRKSLQYGGDLLYLELMAPRIKLPRLVLLCDVSGSMDQHFRLILEFAHTLLKVEKRAEVFLFSTDIARVTFHMRVRDPEGFLSELPRLMPQWGAGTRIGRSLKSLRERFGSKVLAGQPVVAIYSDGWDQGEIDLLKKEMEFLKRRCKALIWLNPLAGAPDYEPVCKGMAAALPFLDLLLPFRSMEDIFGLGKEIRKLLA